MCWKMQPKSPFECRLPGISELALLPESFLRRKEAEQVSALGSPPPLPEQRL